MHPSHTVYEHFHAHPFPTPGPLDLICGENATPLRCAAQSDLIPVLIHDRPDCRWKPLFRAFRPHYTVTLAPRVAFATSPTI